MHRALLFSLSVVLVGCASVPESGMPPFEGTSNLDDALKADGYAKAYALARTSGCSSIDRVVVAGFPLSTWRPERTVVGEYRSTPDQTLAMTERWVLHGCGRTYPFRVNLSDNLESGTAVDVRPDF